MSKLCKMLPKKHKFHVRAKRRCPLCGPHVGARGAC